MAHAEAFVVLGDGFALADVAADDGARKRGANTRLIDLNLDLMNLSLAAFDQSFIPMQIVLGAFRREFGGFEVSLTRKP